MTEFYPGGEELNDELLVDPYSAYINRARRLQSDLNFARFTLDEDEFHDLACDVVRELDGMSPYIGEPVYISGFGLLPDTDVDDDGDTVTEHDDDDFVIDTAVVERDSETRTVYGFASHEGWHMGASVIKMQTDFGTEYKVRHAIRLGSETMTLARGTIGRVNTYFGFFELDSTVLLIDDIEGSLVSHLAQDENDPDYVPGMSPERMVQVLAAYSLKFTQLLRSTSFRRMGLPQQRAAIDTIVKQAEVNSQIQDKYVNLTLKEDEVAKPKGRRKLFVQPRDSLYVYTPNIEAPDEPPIRAELPYKQLGGMCVGVDSIEQPNLRPRPFRRDGDLRDKNAGLCLLIDPDDEVKEQLESDQILYVPLGQGVETKIYGE